MIDFPWWSLPIRLLLFPIVFTHDCAVLLSLPLMNEYVNARQIRSGRGGLRRWVILRDWLPTSMRNAFPELA